MLTNEHFYTHTDRYTQAWGGRGEPGINNLKFFCINDPILLVAHQTVGSNPSRII